MDKIVCVGKNYPAHAEELGESQPEQPVLFIKPPSALFQVEESKSQTEIPLPLPFADIHHELEIVFRLGDPKATIPFSAFSLGLDLTRRDLQMSLKKSGQPWEIAKVFKNSAVLGPWCSWADWANFKDQDFSLKVNGQTRQSGRFEQILWSPESCVNLARQYFPLFDGDLLYTGTPVGVGPLKYDDRLELKFGEKIFAKLLVQKL